MTLRTPYADVVLPNQTQAAGTFASGPVAESGVARWCVLYVNVSAASGTTHTLDAKLQGSTDGATWTDIISAAQVTGTSATVITAAPIPYDYVQVVATVGGTGSPSVTFECAAVIL